MSYHLQNTYIKSNLTTFIYYFISKILKFKMFITYIYIHFTHTQALQCGCGIVVMSVISALGNPGSSPLCCKRRKSYAKTLQILTAVGRGAKNPSFCVFFLF